jgi:hypothetical protein
MGQDSRSKSLMKEGRSSDTFYTVLVGKRAKIYRDSSGRICMASSSVFMANLIDIS